MTSLKTSIKTITYLSDIGCLEIQGASLSYYIIAFYIVKRFAGKKRVSGEDHLNSMKNIILIIAFTDKTVSATCIALPA